MAWHFNISKKLNPDQNHTSTFQSSVSLTQFLMYFNFSREDSNLEWILLIKKVDKFDSD